jgi:hypothetical protein
MDPTEPSGPVSRRSFFRKALATLSAGVVLSTADWISPTLASANAILLGCYVVGPVPQRWCFDMWPFGTICMCYDATYYYCLWWENGCMSTTVEVSVSNVRYC